MAEATITPTHGAFGTDLVEAADQLKTEPCQQESEAQRRLHAVVNVLAHGLQAAHRASEVAPDQGPRMLEQGRVGDQERPDNARNQTQGSPVGSPEEALLGTCDTERKHG
jgi:hypothetical protein